MSKRKILFLVDHKHRDLPSLSLIGFFLKKKHKIYFRPLSKPDIEIIDPEFIIISRIIRNKRQMPTINKWQSEKRKIIVIDSEGNQQSKTFLPKISFKPDLLFIWNKTELERHSKEIAKYKIKTEICGSPRLDFFHDKFKNFFSEIKKLKKELAITKNKVVTFAMNNSYEDLSQQHKDKIKERYYETYYHNYGFEDKLQHMLECRRRLVETVFFLLKNYENINIVIKPHPNENITFWQNLVNENEKLKIMIGKPINDLLKISDIHIGMKGCLTIVEASLMKVPNIELDTESKLSEKEFFKEHLNLALFSSDDENDFKKHFDRLIDDEVSEKEFNDHQIKINKYVNKYLYKFDAKRCKDYANKLDSFINNYEMNKKFNNTNMANLIRFYKITENKFENFKILIKNFIKEKILNIKTLDARGRFDNRIKIGDEKFWYKEFEKKLNI